MKTWFLLKKIGILLSHENKNHANEITAEFFYKPLYNLSNIELITLKKYIEFFLDKKWIRHSTNFAKTPILFVSKKR